MDVKFLIIIFVIILINQYNCDPISHLESKPINKLIAKSGKYCDSFSTCGDAHQVCHNYRCYCKTNYKYDYTTETCLYSSCTSNMNCWNYDYNRICKSGNCVCGDFYSASNTDSQICILNQTALKLSTDVLTTSTTIRPTTKPSTTMRSTTKRPTTRSTTKRPTTIRSTTKRPTTRSTTKRPTTIWSTTKRPTTRSTTKRPTTIRSTTNGLTTISSTTKITTTMGSDNEESGYPWLLVWIITTIVLFILIVTSCVTIMYRRCRILNRGGIVHTISKSQVQPYNGQKVQPYYGQKVQPYNGQNTAYLNKY